MKSKKSSLFSRKLITIRKINNLLKKALKDKPILVPSKGYQFLEDIEPGKLFETQNRMRGVYLESTPTSSKVIITSCNNVPEEDRAYYLGKQNIANSTNVKIIK
jgi:hypothetical protein